MPLYLAGGSTPRASPAIPSLLEYSPDRTSRTPQTCILYVNENWVEQQDGGHLCMHDASHDCWRTVAPCADSLVLFRSDLVLHRVCALPTMAHRRPSLSSSPALIAMAPSRIGRARMKLALGGPTYEARGEVRPPAPQRVRRPGPPRAHARGPREHDAPPAAPGLVGFRG